MTLYAALVSSVVFAGCMFRLPEPRDDATELADAQLDASRDDDGRTPPDGSTDTGGSAADVVVEPSPDASTPCGVMPMVDLFTDPTFACWTKVGGAAPSLVPGEGAGSSAVRFVVAKGGGRKHLSRAVNVPANHNHVRLAMSVRITNAGAGFIKGPTLVFDGGAELALSVFNQKLYCDGDPGDSNDVAIGTVTANGEWQRVVVDVVDRATGTTMTCSAGGAEAISTNEANLGALTSLRIAAPLDETEVTFDIDTLELSTDQRP